MMWIFLSGFIIICLAYSVLPPGLAALSATLLDS